MTRLGVKDYIEKYHPEIVEQITERTTRVNVYKAVIERVIDKNEEWARKENIIEESGQTFNWSVIKNVIK